MAEFSGSGAGSGALGGAAIGTQIMPGWGTAIGAVAGGLVGGLTGGSKKDPRQEAAERMAAAYEGTITPGIMDRIYEIADYSVVGQLTPEEETAILQEASKLEEIQVDPRLRNAQMDALMAMQERAGGGLTAQELANLEQIKQAQEGQSSADRQAIMQSRARRGIAGGGDELAAQLQASQQAAQTAGTRGMDLASMMQNARMEATQQYADQAGNVRYQDYGQDKDKASAQDAINAFNVQQRSGTQQRNVSAKNLAEASNLTNQQNIANMNTANATARSKLASDAKLGYAQDELKRQLGAAGQDQLGVDTTNNQKYQDEKSANQFTGIMGNLSTLGQAAAGTSGTTSGTTMAGEPYGNARKIS